MLAVVFTLGEDRFAAPASIVREIAPLSVLMKTHKAPDYVAGLLDYRGEIIPIIDLCRLIMGRPCRRLMSTRIIIADYNPAPAIHRTIGLLAEQVTDTTVVNELDLNPSGLALPDARYLGDIFKTEDGLAQFVQVEDILDADVRNLLYSEEGHAA